MKQTMWKLFPFESIDSKAAEAWLNRLGAEGWRLGEWKGGRVRFWREKRPVSYAVTLERGEDRTFRALCRDAGWDWAGHSGEMHVYISLPGRDPAPMQTDPALESRTYFRRYLHLTAGRMLLPLLAAGLNLRNGIARGWSGSPGLNAVGAVLFLVLFLLLAAALVWDVSYLLRVRRTGTVLPRAMACIWLRWWLIRAVTAVALLWLAAWLLWRPG